MPVNNKVYMVLKYTPGRLNFGDGIKADVDISAWYEWNGRELLLMEFSYKHNRNECNKYSKGVIRCAQFFKKININTKEWLAKGFSKTFLIYGY